MSTALELAATNLTSIPVLAFVLGLLAATLRADLRLPDAVYQAISMYLLLAIGIKGGVALRESSFAAVVGPVTAAVILGIVIPLLAYVILRVLTRLGPIDRGALAAHYGSTSLVTFTAAVVFLETAAVPFEGYVSTLLTVLEIPGIIVGLVLAGRARNTEMSWGATLREVLTAKSVLLLAGGLVIGLVSGPEGYRRVEPFFGALFIGILSLFLLEMGALVGRRLPDVRRAGPGLIVFAIVFPLLSGTLGVLAGTLTGMSTGGSMVLGVLCASASYIAAPAAVRLMLPEANPAYTLTASLAITFPFNLIVGIPVLYALAGWINP